MLSIQIIFIYFYYDYIIGSRIEAARMKQVITMGNPVIKQVDSWVCDIWEDYKVTCWLDAKVAVLTRCIDRLLGSDGEKPVVMVYVGINDVGK